MKLWHCASTTRGDRLGQILTHVYLILLLKWANTLPKGQHQASKNCRVRVLLPDCTSYFSSDPWGLKIKCFEEEYASEVGDMGYRPELSSQRVSILNSPSRYLSWSLFEYMSFSLLVKYHCHLGFFFFLISHFHIKIFSWFAKIIKFIQLSFSFIPQTILSINTYIHIYVVVSRLLTYKSIAS